VIEHLDDDRQALQEFLRVVKPSGVVVLTAPALMSLWSEWDVALHHRRRYTLPQFLQLFDGLKVELIHASYINTLAFFPIFMLRQLRNLLGKQQAGQRMEDWVPAKPINDILRGLFVFPALWRVRMPVGVSVFAVLRKQP